MRGSLKDRLTQVVLSYVFTLLEINLRSPVGKASAWKPIPNFAPPTQH